MSRAFAVVRALTVEAAGVPIVRDVSMTAPAGQVTALVGASGAGKSSILLALLDLLDDGRRRTAGQFELDGSDFWAWSPAAQRRARGDRLAWVPQAPGEALSPGMRIVDQVAEVVRAHRPASAAEARRRAAAALRAHGVPAERMRAFPHELSGGQRQRASMAMAMVLAPSLVLADEPTTALDGPATHAVLGLLRAAARAGAAVLWVTHEIAWVRAYADRVALLAGGCMAWEAPRAAALERLGSGPNAFAWELRKEG